MSKKRVPKKNIDPILVDVKKPNYNYSRTNEFKTVNLTRVPQAPKNKKGKVCRFFIGAIFVICSLLLFWTITIIVNAGELKIVLSEKTGEIMENFSSSVQALKEFRFYDAENFLAKNETHLASINNTVKKSYGDVVLKSLGAVVPQFKNIGEIFDGINGLNSDMLSFTRNLIDVQSSGLKDFQSDGNKFIENISAVRSEINSIAERMELIRNNFAELKKMAGFFDKYEIMASEGYITYSKDMHQIDDFFEGILSVLDSENEKHILVLFQNTAEIRPGGGFVGSYADVTIKNGGLNSIDVRDIYDPDGQLDMKIVPPQEIKTMSTDWGARDANWFFDFPASARTILFFLENSKMYSEKGITFDGVIGLNINVIESVLSVIGPVTLPDYGVTIDEGNFLFEVQREVEAGEDKKAGEPKRILKVLAPIILERIGALSKEQSEELMSKVSEHFSEKDVMVYAKDKKISGFLASSEADGSVSSLPNNFWGSYLAVVNANIAGGKTDAFIAQSIDARIDIDSDGNIFSDVSIEREHNGDKEKDAWWRVTNKNFIQIYTTPGSSLVSMQGNSVKNLVSRFDYDGEGYEVYPDLAIIEKTRILLSGYNAWSFEAFGKSVFATWFNVPAGNKKTLSVRYQTPATDKTFVEKGKIFTFIFEPQSGVASKLKVVISAPLGYIWEEAQSPFFTFESDAPALKKVLTLTLSK